MIITQTVEVRVDEFDHETPADTRTFEYDGTTYEIDLAEANHLDLKEALDWFERAQTRMLAFVKAARPVIVPDEPEAEPEVAATQDAEEPPKKRATTRKRASKTRRVASDSEVRAWAQEHGVTVNSHGRVPKRIRDLYVDAN